MKLTRAVVQHGEFRALDLSGEGSKVTIKAESTEGDEPKVLLTEVVDLQGNYSEGRAATERVLSVLLERSPIRKEVSWLELLLANFEERL